MTSSSYAKYSGLGGGGGGSSYTFADSIVNAGGIVTLVNDSAAPGNSQYYGTNSGGTLGYFSLPTVTAGNLTDAGTDGIIITNGVDAVIGTGTSIAQHVADTSHNGYLSSTDWNTFNGKQAAGNYITVLMGDIIASGPGSAASSLVATTNTTLTSLANLVTVGTIGTGTWAGTTIAVNHGGTGQVTAAAAFNALSPITTTGDIIYSSSGTTNQRLAIGSSGNVLTVSGGVPVWAPPATSGTVTSVGLSVPATSIFGTSGTNPVTGSGTIGITTTGTSGGIPYFSSTSQLASSALLTASQLVLGGGAGTAPVSLAAGSQYQVLTMGASNPEYGALNLGQSAAVTGILPVANTTVATQAIGTVTTTATITWSAGSLFTMTLTNGNTAVVTFSGAVSGQTIVVEVTNGATTGTGVVTWPTVKWAGGTAPTMSTGANALDVYTFIYNGSYYVGSYVQNLS